MQQPFSALGASEAERRSESGLGRIIGLSGSWLSVGGRPSHNLTLARSSERQPHPSGSSAGIG